MPFPSLTAANCNPEAAPYEIPLSSGKGSLEGVHTVPCEVDKPEPTNGPRAYEVPSSSTLPLSYKAASSDCVEANDRLQGKTHFNMGCHDNRVLCNPTARPTYDSISEHEYQETEDVDLVAERSYSLLEVRVLANYWPPLQPLATCNALHAPSTVCNIYSLVIVQP